MSPAPKSAAVYLLFIDITATTKGFEVRRNSNQDILVLTCDQAIYKILVDIAFHQPVLLTTIVPQNMEGVPYAAEHILKLVKCGCVSE